MRTSRRIAAAGSIVALSLTGLVACGGDDSGSGASAEPSGSASAPAVSADDFTSDFSAMEALQPVAEQGDGMVAVLLPDTTTSARYVTFDAPYLKQAFESAGLDSSQFKIDNAQGSAATMQTQAEAAMTSGASVLLVDPLDSGSGAAIESAARDRGVKVVDYDRLTQGGSPDRVYVSFDNVKVGQLIGQGLVDAVDAWNVKDPNVLVMSGDPTDNNAKLFAEGYNSVLDPLFKAGDYTKVGAPAGTWDPDVAQTTFAQQYTAHPQMNAVVTPNDDNANAVISYLQSKKVPARTFPTTGQDASLSGLQNILKGYQAGTVYKPIYLEAQAAAAIALYLRAGLDVPDGLVNGTTADDQTGDDVASSLLTPVWVTAENMADTVVADGAVDVDELCIAALEQACTEAGID
ncbi:MAG TPA: substrate-binding domain-containing protein [Nocardioides sp.]|uniref:sugar ABC transporter substrate-binding protein n=1 Tax=Nocardioides sp. TaxID=35761 RepID=UPI002C92F02C|nr:substrate-binding domain-containing protein [Nocardioides sp.]HTW13845.1 substrate-binding domain-containing protein [Nocardioides sp.]